MLLLIIIYTFCNIFFPYGLKNFFGQIMFWEPTFLKHWPRHIMLIFCLWLCWIEFQYFKINGILLHRNLPTVRFSPIFNVHHMNRIRIARVRTCYIPHFSSRSDQNFWNLPESSGKQVNRNSLNFLRTRRTTTTRQSSWRKIRFQTFLANGPKSKTVLQLENILLTCKMV